jgi:hypothetical protein
MRNFLKTIVSAVVLCSALMAAADIANAQQAPAAANAKQAATDYGKRSSYMPEDATTVAQGANSDFGGMPYRGGWTQFQRPAAKLAAVAVASKAPKYPAPPPIRPGL